MDKIRIAYCLTLYDALNNILFEDAEPNTTPVERKIPFKTKYKIQKNLNTLAKDYVYFEDERHKLIQEYGEQQGNNVVVKEENLEKYKEDLGKILSMEVERDFSKLSEKEIEDISDDIFVDCAGMELLIKYIIEQ